MEQVILVDEQDREIGVMDKLQAHREGRLHRAFSIFIFNSKGEMLLQQRASEKYHSAGLWSNTCCSHPRPGEDVHMAAVRRLQEEMGMSCNLTEVFSFVYNAPLYNGLTEYEYDHVFTGISDKEPLPDKSEVADWKYLNMETIANAIENSPHEYTEWFKLCITANREQLVNKTR